MNTVAIIIPVYTTTLSEHEKNSLLQLGKVLGHFPLFVVKPESLDAGFLLKMLPEISFKSFPDKFFNGIKGYNKLMLSPLFYQEFKQYNYILIHQLDAWIFKDNLEYWCSQGYDYIGAPWIKRDIYNKPIVKQYMQIIGKIKKTLSRPDKQILYNKCGNGGLSLRKVSSHLEASLQCNHIIQEFTSKKRFHMYNEDVFWSVIVNQYYQNKFKYPHYMVALGFSFDKYPAYCYKLNGNNLPFGCHGWSKKEMYPFWKNHIP
ncbi:MAG: DUF5672 family protein [Bacteroidales bacterium]|nr:DUF5672 family protein [Bacteroidales bacterium]MDD3299418.1 DUF5672 family protein [Bacteroidales bacterium]MDD3843398.1 DUF5672 family protein [Bacteroidales bacterium]MDD4617680.1 DUF5672 family protein [Bacteroidales bacterium]